MAIATTTALTAAAIGVGAAQAGMGFSEAAKQQQNKREAELGIERAMGQVLKEQEKIYSEELSIQKEPYELEREALMVTGAQGIEAARESERGMARIPAVQAVVQQGQRGIASAMGQEMMGLDLAVVQEKAKRGDILSQIYLGEVAGQQMAAANADEARAQAIQQGFQGAQTMVSGGLDFIPEASFDPAIASMNRQQRQQRQQRRRFNRFDRMYGDEYLNPYGTYEGSEAIIG